MNRQLVSLAALAIIVIGGGLTVYALRQDTPAASDAANATDRPAAGAAMAEVRQAKLAGADILGETAFNAKCAACHGANAAGQNGVAPPLVHKIYEPGHHGDQAFFLAVENGARAHHWPFGNMPPVEGLTRSDVGNIIAYVRAIQRANGIE
ncbi:MAG: hypothetical protein B7Z02_06605 [Rhodobacterales bacterium 32-67-9]|nr:MAG: hypothetical protein B7Z02_06605 [Rhodobacterales bacterium 32-67-9]